MHSTFAPQSISMTPCSPAGSTGASAARRIPWMRFTVSVAPVRSAPVLPAETTASPSPSLSIRSATAMEESFFRLVAVLGSSSMVTVSLASTISTETRSSSSRQARIASFCPTSVMSTPSSFFALRAPLTISCGALSPPIASTMIFNVENLLFHQPIHYLERPP